MEGDRSRSLCGRVEAYGRPCRLDDLESNASHRALKHFPANNASLGLRFSRGGLLFVTQDLTDDLGS